jgi:hypothetical protein
MFSGMRDKSMEWYDLREDGIASLLNRIETWVCSTKRNVRC